MDRVSLSLPQLVWDLKGFVVVVVVDRVSLKLSQIKILNN